MADYTNFPFAVMTTREIVSLMIESHAIGDAEFAEACRLEIARRPEGELDKPQKTPQEHFGAEDARDSSAAEGMIICRNCRKRQSVLSAGDMIFGLYTCGYCGDGICDWDKPPIANSHAQEIPERKWAWRGWL